LAKVNWPVLNGTQKFDAISIPGFSQAYGVSFLSVVDYDDKDYSLDLWRAMLSNKTFAEYYLSELEFSVVKYDKVPDEKTGRLQIIFQSDGNPRHNKPSTDSKLPFLISGQHYLFVFLTKVTISSKPSTDSKLPFLHLAAGLALNVDLEFNYLVTRFPNSQMAVGVVLFSNNSMSPTEDFQNSRRYFSRPGGASRRYQVTDVKLSSTHDTGPFPLSAEGHRIRNLTAPTPTAVFRPSPVCFFDKEGSKSGPVFTGPRKSLSQSQRRRLRGSLAKAIFGARYNQQFYFQGKRDERRWLKWSKALPIGMRLQYFAFGSPDDASLKSSKYLFWSSILSMVPVDLPTGEQTSDISKESLMAWGLMALNWASAVSSQLGL
uniref:GH131_N domain-containing protein n=1 Tax=Schistocephalus solidus TaxID=70667 RepID=A0A183TFQ8_SCHSO